jgi:CDP-diglyceride synthetase
MNAWGCALFLVAAFVIAGVAQTAWFVAPVSRRFAVPLDGGASLRGRRIFGDNKTLRGFLVMVPAAALSFMGIAFVLGNPAATGLWPLTPAGYAWLGACAGFGFMAGELPNSFVKRQLDIDPGASVRGGWAAAAQFAIDRLDSGVGMLLAVSLAAPTPLSTWPLVLAIGFSFHWAFSMLMFQLGLKARPA